MNEVRVNGAARAVRFLGMMAVAGVVVLAFLLWGVPVYGRYQVCANAANEIQVNELRIQQTEQLVQVEKQKAPHCRCRRYCQVAADYQRNIDGPLFAA
jgi:hypothetical protein